jgi:hypothetical protein
MQGEADIAGKVAGQVRELGGHIEEITAVKVRDRAMEGGEMDAKFSDRQKIAR